jgi:hypothetical protein
MILILKNIFKNSFNTNKKLYKIFITTFLIFSIVIVLKLIKYDYQLLSYLRPNHTNSNHNYIIINKNKPKIFCMITTTYANHETKAIHVKNTWAKRCDGLLFLSSENNSTLPAIKICGEDSHDTLWCKVSIVSFTVFFRISKTFGSIINFLDKIWFALCL